MKVQALAVVGVGLIGGSVALAARRHRVTDRIIGVDRDPAALDQARTAGVIDDACLEGLDAARESDLVVVCTPVDDIAAQVVTAACRPGVIVTDTGSTKATIVAAVRSAHLAPGAAFVPGHPLAGSEKQGPAHARADLFEGKLVVLTPDAETDAHAVAQVRSFWEALGARVRLMDAAEHDRALALTSHLPHLVASALAGSLPPGLDDLAATGFRDTTRLASGDPRLWEAIFRANRAGVLEALGQFEERLRTFRDALARDDADALKVLLALAKSVRDRLDGPLV